ncbi:MAG TPA: putative Fe-S cluster assembly protein SufT [Candidatus Acidoferrales bacterium]|nr:putative Fe-S cluster assembly protein SufT [Candidatus Acidoferrales bacterium]
MDGTNLIKLARDCKAVEIPAGTAKILPAATSVRIVQKLGGSYTVADDYGYLFRIEAADADALGIAAETSSAASAPAVFTDQLVWDQLKTIFDPEIPVNVVDLGLIYSCIISKLDAGGRKIDIKMSVTAPGCGMAGVLKSDVETKLSRLPEVREVRVEVVFDPPWNPSFMSESAKLQLGFDADYGGPSSAPSPFG